MYSIAILLKELTLKVDRQALLYHQITAYDHVIAYDRFAFVVIDTEAMINYLAARKLRHGKSHFDVMRRAVHIISCVL